MRLVKERGEGNGEDDSKHVFTATMQANPTHPKYCSKHTVHVTPTFPSRHRDGLTQLAIASSSSTGEGTKDGRIVNVDKKKNTHERNENKR